MSNSIDEQRRRQGLESWHAWKVCPIEGIFRLVGSDRKVRHRSLPVTGIKVPGRVAVGYHVLLAVRGREGPGGRREPGEGGSCVRRIHGQSCSRGCRCSPHLCRPTESSSYLHI